MKLIIVIGKACPIYMAILHNVMLARRFAISKIMFGGSTKQEKEILAALI